MYNSGSSSSCHQLVHRTEVPKVTICFLKIFVSDFHSENGKRMGRNRKHLNAMNTKATCGSRNKQPLFAKCLGQTQGPEPPPPHICDASIQPQNEILTHQLCFITCRICFKFSCFSLFFKKKTNQQKNPKLLNMAHYQV